MRTSSASRSSALARSLTSLSATQPSSSPRSSRLCASAVRKMSGAAADHLIPERRGRAFAYRDPDGRRVRDAGELARIEALAVPPAWTDVWTCPDRYGHVQATGRDARGRKQYRCHPRWREFRDADKYGRMLAFGRALPAIRGLTTLRDRHVEVEGDTLRFVSRAKGGRERHVGVHDRRVARVVRRLEELPGRELFQYVDDDGRR